MQSKFTPETIALILSLLRECVPISTAATRAGVTYATVKSWRAQGRADPDSVYGEFERAVSEAVAEAEIQMVRTIYSNAAIDPKSAMWMLERRFGGRWSARSKVDSVVKAEVKHDHGAIAVYLPAVDGSAPDDGADD